MRWPEVRHAVTKNLQGLCWVYLTNNFEIATLSELVAYEPKVKCSLSVITEGTCDRVREFRDRSRVEEYRKKLSRNEIGFFAECNGKAVGSIWASINRSRQPEVMRKHIRLLPNEALIHDIVTGEQCKGMGVGPFMVANISTVLLTEYRVNRIVIDVNRKNMPSLRMMDKVGLKVKEQVLCISVLGKLVFEKTLWQQGAAC